MATTRDYIDYLNDQVDIAPTNSQEELQAAQLIQQIMDQHGVETKLQEFEAPTAGNLPYRVLMILLFLGIVLSGFYGTPAAAVGVVIVFLCGVLFLLKQTGHGFLSSLGGRARSQNVVGVHRAEGPLVVKGNRPIVIVAHYDTPRESLLYKPSVARFQPLLLTIAPICVGVACVLGIFQLFSFVPEVARRVLWVLGLIAALPLLALGVDAIYQRFAPYTEGANDNKASVAAMLGVLDKVRPGNDVATGYAHAAVERHAAKPAPEPDEVVDDLEGFDLDEPFDYDGFAELDEPEGYDEPVEDLELDEVYDDELEPEFDESYEEFAPEADEAPVAEAGYEAIAEADELASDEPAAEDEEPVDDFAGFEAAPDSEAGAVEGASFVPSFARVRDVEEPEPEEEPEPAIKPQIVTERYEEVVGTRHGKEVIESLQMLPQTCEVEYVEPKLLSRDARPQDELDRRGFGVISGSDVDEWESDEQEYRPRRKREKSGKSIFGKIGAFFGGLRDQFFGNEVAEDEVYDALYDTDFEADYSDEAEEAYLEDLEERANIVDDEVTEAETAEYADVPGDTEAATDTEIAGFEPVADAEEIYSYADEATFVESDLDAYESETGVVDSELDAYEDEVDVADDELDAGPVIAEYDTSYAYTAEPVQEEFVVEETEQPLDAWEEPVAVESEPVNYEDEDAAIFKFDDEIPDAEFEVIEDAEVQSEPYFESAFEPVAEWEPEPEPEEAIELEPEAEFEAVYEEEPEYAFEPQAEPEPEVGYAFEPQAEPEPEVGYAFEPQVEPEPEVEYEEHVYAAPEPVSFIEPEPMLDVEPVVEPEPAAFEFEPVAEPEPVAEAIVEPQTLEDEPELVESVLVNPVPAFEPEYPEPEPAFEPEPEPEPALEFEADYLEDDDFDDSDLGSTASFERIVVPEPVIPEPEPEPEPVIPEPEPVPYVDEEPLDFEAQVEPEPEVDEAASTEPIPAWKLRIPTIEQDDPFEPESAVTDISSLVPGIAFEDEYLPTDEEIDLMDGSGLTELVDDDFVADNPQYIEPAPKAEAVDDPNWGKSEFQPARRNVARRASLFDLPDPSLAESDPFESSAGGGRSTFKFTDDDEQSSNHWKGGATTRAGLRVVDDGEYDDVETVDEFSDLDARPLNEEEQEELRDAILAMGDDELIAHDIWFVALGASELDHAGMKSFLREYRSKIRGAFLINLDCVGAGDLTLLTSEGQMNGRKTDRRVMRLLSNIADDLHIPVHRAAHAWEDTDATPAMRKSVRALTIMGMEEGVAALSHTSEDRADLVDPGQASSITALLTELIRRA